MRRTYGGLGPVASFIYLRWTHADLVHVLDGLPSLPHRVPLSAALCSRLFSFRDSRSSSSIAGLDVLFAGGSNGWCGDVLTPRTRCWLLQGSFDCVTNPTRR